MHWWQKECPQTAILQLMIVSIHIGQVKDGFPDVAPGLNTF